MRLSAGAASPGAPEREVERDESDPSLLAAPATIAAMLIASWIAGLVWHAIFNFPLPSYVGGAVGGLAALPVWDFLKRPSA